MINGILALLIGLYLILVLYRGNEGKMLQVISEQQGFLAWGGALLVAAYIYANVSGKYGEMVKSLVIVALAAMLLKNGQQMFNEFDNLFKSAQPADNKHKIGSKAK